MATTRSRWVRNQIVYYPSNYHHRWLEAYGDQVAKFVSHFIDDSPDCWTTTAVSVGTGTSTAAGSDAVGGVMRINAAANENDGAQRQLIGESFLFGTDTPLYFGARWQLDEATQSDAFVGLCVTNTTIIASVSDNLCGFTKNDGDANINYQTRAGGTGDAVDSGSDIVASTYIITEFHHDGAGNLRFYLDGTLLATATTNISATEMCVSVAYLNGAGTMQNKGLDLDWLRCIQILA